MRKKEIIFEKEREERKRYLSSRRKFPSRERERRGRGRKRGREGESERKIVREGEAISPSRDEERRRRMKEEKREREEGGPREMKRERMKKVVDKTW